MIKFTTPRQVIAAIDALAPKQKADAVEYVNRLAYLEAMTLAGKLPPEHLAKTAAKLPAPKPVAPKAAAATKVQPSARPAGKRK